MQQPLAMKNLSASLVNSIRYLSLSLLILTSSAAMATSYSGVISKINTKVFLLFSNSPASLEVKVLTADAQNTLNQLESGDFLEGSGEIVNSTLVLDTIDFVSLAELLGTWVSNNQWIQFKDFSNSMINIPVATQDGHKVVAAQYSIVLGPNNTWKILFSTQDKVLGASLIITGTKAYFDFFDQNSGNTQVYQFNKINSSHVNKFKPRK